MLSYHDVVGIIAGLIFLIGFFPYLLTAVRGKSKPNRATWWIWAVVSTILAASYYSSGASSTIWVPILSAICCLTVALSSFKYGTGGWNTFDRTCLFLAFISLLFWWRFNSPEIALWMNLFIDLLGAIPTMRKAYLEPKSEDYLSWLLFFLGNTLNLFALQNWDIVVLSYPVYLFVMTGTVVLLLSRSRLLLKASNKLATKDSKVRAEGRRKSKLH